MTRINVRKVQAVCFLCAHIPLAAVAAFSYYTDLSEQTALLAVAFVSTLVSALLLWTCIGKAMAPGLDYESA